MILILIFEHDLDKVKMNQCVRYLCQNLLSSTVIIRTHTHISLIGVYCAIIHEPLTFSRFGTVPACVRRTDRQTDGRTDGYTTTAYTAL